MPEQTQPQSVKLDIIKRHSNRESIDDIAYTHGMTNGAVQAVIDENVREILDGVMRVGAGPEPGEDWSKVYAPRPPLGKLRKL